MSQPAAMPYFGDAYMADTRHLSLEEHGAYHLLLLIAWRSPDCALPDDDKRLAQMLGVTAKKWAALKPVVMAFWSKTENGWEQKRLTKERRWVEEKARKNKDAAEARWNGKPKKPTEIDDANASANGQADADANGDAPPPPPAKSSEANASGGGAADPVKALFDVGVALLVETGSTEKQARSLIGKWRKGRKDGEVLTALLDCRNRAISNPVEWLEKRFVGGRYVSASGYEYRGDIEAVIREAERRNDMATYWKAKGDLKREQRTAA
jgi:uncharacterized protein YdaU (DUF1376 family)